MNFGFEVEFFATEGRKVFNAEKLIKVYLEKALRLNSLTGFKSKNLAHYQGGRNCLIEGQPYDLISDGTPFEVVGTKIACLPSMLDGMAVEQININLKQIREYITILFHTQTSLVPYLSTDDCEFIDPGTVYSSAKKNHNAYTGETKYSDKKESNKLVTFRTAGFHIHIRFDYYDEEEIFKGQYAPVKCNELVAELDKVYAKYFPSCLASDDLIQREERRNKEFATLGDYRLKYHYQGSVNGFTTLEYRQFSAAFFTLPLITQKKIFHDFSNTVKKFTNRLKK